METRYNYGLLLKEAGCNEEAKTQFRTVMDERNFHPAHVRRASAKWVSALAPGVGGAIGQRQLAGPGRHPVFLTAYFDKMILMYILHDQ